MPKLRIVLNRHVSQDLAEKLESVLSSDSERRPWVG
jgi:hypothetical protein